MKSDNPSRLSESIAEELREWLKSQPGDKMNPLLSISGMFSPLSVRILDTRNFFTRPGSNTRYAR